jgi:hypothetical protein
MGSGWSWASGCKPQPYAHSPSGSPPHTPRPDSAHSDSCVTNSTFPRLSSSSVETSFRTASADQQLEVVHVRPAAIVAHRARRHSTTNVDWTLVWSRGTVFQPQPHIVHAAIARSLCDLIFSPAEPDSPSPSPIVSSLAADAALAPPCIAAASAAAAAAAAGGDDDDDDDNDDDVAERAASSVPGAPGALIGVGAHPSLDGAAHGSRWDAPAALHSLARLRDAIPTAGADRADGRRSRRCVFMRVLGRIIVVAKRAARRLRFNTLRSRLDDRVHIDSMRTRFFDIHGFYRDPILKGYLPVFCRDGIVKRYGWVQFGDVIPKRLPEEQLSGDRAMLRNLEVANAAMRNMAAVDICLLFQRLKNLASLCPETPNPPAKQNAAKQNAKENQKSDDYQKSAPEAKADDSGRPNPQHPLQRRDASNDNITRTHGPNYNANAGVRTDSPHPHFVAHAATYLAPNPAKAATSLDANRAPGSSLPPATKPAETSGCVSRRKPPILDAAKTVRASIAEYAGLKVAEADKPVPPSADRDGRPKMPTTCTVRAPAGPDFHSDQREPDNITKQHRLAPSQSSMDAPATEPADVKLVYTQLTTATNALPTVAPSAVNVASVLRGGAAATNAHCADSVDPRADRGVSKLPTTAHSAQAMPLPQMYTAACHMQMLRVDLLDSWTPHAIFQWLQMWQYRAEWELSVTVTAYHYTLTFVRATGIRLRPENWRTIFLLAMFLAQKILDDYSLELRDVPALYPIVNVKTCRAIERALVRALESQVRTEQSLASATDADSQYAICLVFLSCVLYACSCTSTRRFIAALCLTSCTNTRLKSNIRPKAKAF